jgi:adenosine deaminase
MATQTPSVLSADTIRSAPKVLLHDHLDGGLRPSSIVELAAEQKYTKLPTTNVDELEQWIRRGADRLSLPLYLETFEHTCGVLQDRDALVRVASECAQDLAHDGVVYAEVRYAPEQHLENGLTLDEVVLAVEEGIAHGAAVAAKAGHTIVIGTLLCAMRQAAQSTEIAQLAVRNRDHGVVGFDIAGPENGFPPSRHSAAFELIHEANFHTTIHAGEAFGLPSIHEALQYCGAERLGHGVRIVDDITVNADGTYKLGQLANFVRDTRVPLEMCPTSNVHTGAAASISAHPIDLLKRLRFRVTVNTDNRLMSGCSMTSEFQALVDTFGYDLTDMQWFTVNAMKSAFWPFDDRLRLINQVIKPGYAALMAQPAGG